MDKCCYLVKWIDILWLSALESFFLANTEEIGLKDKIFLKHNCTLLSCQQPGLCGAAAADLLQCSHKVIAFMFTLWPFFLLLFISAHVIRTHAWTQFIDHYLPTVMLLSGAFMRHPWNPHQWQACCMHDNISESKLYEEIWDCCFAPAAGTKRWQHWRSCFDNNHTPLFPVGPSFTPLGGEEATRSCRNSSQLSRWALLLI